MVQREVFRIISGSTHFSSQRLLEFMTSVILYSIMIFVMHCEGIVPQVL